MIRYIAENWINCKFILEMMAAGLIYILPLAKRNRCVLRAASGAVVCILCSMFLTLPPGETTLTAWGIAVSTAIFFVEFLLLAALIFFICDIHVYDALFCASCAYATQHFAYSLNEVMLDLAGDVWNNSWIYFFLYAGILAIFYYVFAGKMTDGNQLHMESGQAFQAMLMVLAIVFLLSTLSQQVSRQYGAGAAMVGHLYAMLCCAFALWVQIILQRQNRLEKEMLLNEQLRCQQAEQYDTIHENIEIINRKSHDLKYQIEALRAMEKEEERQSCLDEIEQAVNIYDTSMKTGNEVLDTLLTEKTLYCEAHQIELTCIADGEKVAFVDPVDLYAMLGNALDNAIEYLDRTDNPDKRMIFVMIWSRSNLLMMQVENFCEENPEIRDGLPVTTKTNRDYHGFGLKSIRMTAEKYGGTMSVQFENQTFLLRISMPIPDRDNLRCGMDHC